MNDPVKCCELYKDFGCSHVDGYLCEPEECSMKLEYDNLIDAYNLLEETL